MPKITSAVDKLKLKFVLLITDGSDSFGRNNDKDTVTVIVKQEHSLSHIVDSAPSRDEDKPYTNDDQVIDNNDSNKNDNNNDSLKRQRTKFLLHIKIAWLPLKAHMRILITAILVVISQVVMIVIFTNTDINLGREFAK